MSTGVHQGPLSSNHFTSSEFAGAPSSTSSQAASWPAPGSHRHPGVALLLLSLSATRRPHSSSLGSCSCLRAAPQNVSTIGPPGPNRRPCRSGGTPLASPAALGPIALVPPRPAVPPAATNLVRRPAPVFIWGRPLLGALPCHTPIRRGHSWALGPPPEPVPPWGDPSGVPRLSTPSALTPLRASAQREAALSGLRAPSPTAGRFRPPALSVVAARVRALLATSSGPVPPLGPRQAWRGHDFKHFLAGPSLPRSSGVRHLWVLGHAPKNFVFLSAIFEFNLQKRIT
ncbi:hypothetical protein NDU88_003190 [Pleurodeles waltl]|uniref:Uncharacterized protein n=1 Tax=Pleurodeles waltl TaxID=8319 RepID=A0AAV7M689_PLEWA|nr:hypothetical protein NDU88_003190 [Pleurodeles waltl]